MCGIAGAVALVPGARPDRARVAAMSCHIAHRGPDGEGIWVSPSGRAVLAHRRLSVIDLATGAQPMVDDEADGGTGTALVFNGEIYNYRELRAELARAGDRFRTQSDTEVLLRAVQRRGAGCVDALRGMFAFVAWDERTGRLLLARDRVGKKPLYLHEEDGVLYFASALESLARTARGPLTVDPAAVDRYLSLGYVPAPGTIYREIGKLPAGTLATLEDGRLATRRYWDLAAADAPFAGTYDDAVDRLDALLGEAVALRLRSDVPLGVFLSGGVDSSLVAAMAVRQSATPISTYAIGFDDAEFDESGHAAAVAAHLGTAHHTFHARVDVFDLLPRMVRHYGEPFADSSALPTWILAEHTRRHVTVALGGDGGDEGFVGYDWYATAARLGRLARRIPAPAAATAAWALGSYAAVGAAPGAARAGRLRRGLSVLAADGPGARFAALRGFVGAADAALLYEGPLAAARRAGGDPARGLVGGAYERAGGTALRRMRYADVETYLADGLMPKVDVATMAHGLEARAPLLDQEVLRFALTLPDAYVTGAEGSKRILRTLLYRHVPRALIERPKQGFTPPVERWFAGPLRGRVEALARSERLRAVGLRAEGLATIAREHAAGTRDHAQRLFALVVLDEWLAQR